jgi:hypothetical protein
VTCARQKCVDLAALEKILGEKFTNFFNVVMEGKCMDEAHKQTQEAIKNLGIRITPDVDKNFFDSMKALIEALNNPKFKQCDLEDLIETYIESYTRYVQKQPGLEGFPNSEKLRSDQRNLEFINWYFMVNDITRGIAKNRAPANVHFNAETGKAYGHFGRLFGEMATRIRREMRMNENHSKH